MKKLKASSFLSILIITIILGFFLAQPVFADELSDKLQSTQDQINKLQSKLDDTRKQESNLKTQLDIIDSQAKITELKIDETNLKIEKLKREINDLSSRIVRISSSVDNLSQILLARIAQTYKYGAINTVDVLFASNGVSDMLGRLKYMQVAQANDKKVLYQLQATKVAYNDQKQDKETRQIESEKLSKDLETYKTQLNQQKKTKQSLLAETQGDEATYERLIAQAKAQLAGFQRFTQGQASILNNQTTCDDWGCYYNQRDSQWGSVGLNGTTNSLADYGCLITSMAMIYTHYGHKDVTPLNINSNPGNFSSVAPTYLKYTISANGINSQRAGSIIDNELSANRPVIIGIGAGPDHFIVFTGGSNGNYTMNDPFIANGRNINFTDHYSINSIREIDKVIF